MSDDESYLPNYRPETLYLRPTAKGAYATMVIDCEVRIGEIDLTNRAKLAFSVFYVDEKQNTGTFKITKLQFHAKYGWCISEYITFNNFEFSHLDAFLNLIRSIDFKSKKHIRLSFDKIDPIQLNGILSSTNAVDIIKTLSESPELNTDIFAVAKRRKSLDEFSSLMKAETSEADWQSFFEENTWIFGHGLSYIFLEKAAKKLESITTGATYSESGKRIDGLMRTKAELSQFVLIEIKRHLTPLLKETEYRAGCFQVSNELSGAVTQIQKTVFEFTKRHFVEQMKDENGNNISDTLYNIYPKNYLIIGSLNQIKNNNDKIINFELYRKNISNPEIITFDELYFRAKCITDLLNQRMESLTPSGNPSHP